MIIKNYPINGVNINLRDVRLTDASFILSLRIDSELNRYLSIVEDDLSKQEQWITKSLMKTDERYFIIENKKLEQIGTIRIYDIVDDKFCWGSWIVIPKARKYASFESAILLYDYAFNKLNLNYTNFDIRKENTKVLNFHLRFGARIISENEIDYFFTFSKEDFINKKQEYQQNIKKSI